MVPTNKFLQCSGWTSEKSFIINKILTQEDWNKSILSVNIDGWLLSHAGLAPKFLDDNNYIQIDMNAVLELVKNGGRSPLVGCGYYRGGTQSIGGITWLDWNGEFEDIPGLPQIVGHTPGKAPRQIGASCCLDTHLRHYGIIEDGKFTTHAV